jgi:ABC-type glycerol-3-phosphate transport system permease component
MATTASRQRSPVSKVLLYVVAVIIAVISLFPFFWMLLTAIKPDNEIFSTTPHFITFSPTFSRFTNLLNGNIPQQMLNSLIVAIAVTVVTGAVAFLAAYALTRWRIPLRGVIIVVILAMQMLPQTVVVIPLFQVFRQAGLLNTYAGLVLSHLALTVGLCTYMVRSFLRDIPLELEESAMVEGASRFTALRLIVFPLAWPGIAASSVYAFITSWNELMFSATYMQRPEMETLPVALQQFFSSYYTDWGGVMAASVVFTIPVIIFFLLVQKRLTEGMLSGSVKG